MLACFYVWDVHISTGVCTCMCVHVHVCVCLYVCMHVCESVYVSAFVCFCVYVHVRMCVSGFGGDCIRTPSLHLAQCEF